MSSATLSSESPGLRSPRSRTVIVKACWRTVARRLASPRRSVSLTISRKGRPARRDSAFSFAATSSSRVSVVLIYLMLLVRHHDVNYGASAQASRPPCTVAARLSRRRPLCLSAHCCMVIHGQGNFAQGAYIWMGQSKGRGRKGGRRVTIPVGQPLKAALDAALKEKRSAINILINSFGRPSTEDGFRTSWDKAFRRTSLKDLHFHDLRATAVTRLALSNCSVPEIASITGHSMETVQQILDARYLGPHEGPFLHRRSKFRPPPERSAGPADPPAGKARSRRRDLDHR